MTLGFNNDRITNNSVFTILSPEVDSGFRLTLRQHLLAGFGFGPNLRFIHIARNNREISDVAFRGQVIATVSQIQNIYWDLVNAYEDVKVKERSLELGGEDAFRRSRASEDRRHRSHGSDEGGERRISPQPGSAALAERPAIAGTSDQERDHTRFERSRPGFRSVVPTDTMSIPAVEPVTPLQDLISDAQAHRPELAEARMDLTNREITRKAAANALKPAVDLVAWYGAYGLAGVQTPPYQYQGPPVPPVAYVRVFERIHRSVQKQFA